MNETKLMTNSAFIFPKSQDTKEVLLEVSSIMYSLFYQCYDNLN